MWLQEPNDLGLKLWDRFMIILTHRVDTRGREKIETIRAKSKRENCVICKSATHAKDKCDVMYCISLSAASQPSQDLLERMARNSNMPGGMGPLVTYS